MKCRGCQQEFDNLAQLTKHKPECPGMNGETLVCNGTSEIPDEGLENFFEQDELEAIVSQIEPSGPFTIPLALCPDEIKYYAEGKVVGLRVEGMLTPDGIEVQEVTLIR